ncbi:MAG TPA: DUF58 domain-containing protein [Novimethylophilus sp.]|jgi:uncharacterized protein (DUF58 family)|uniref:DUF58 domain-containing protein n=1 Tax=Novimethylophilus sp. TaxID=2137426 RepID=UPI002F416EFC
MNFPGDNADFGVVASLRELIALRECVGTAALLRLPLSALSSGSPAATLRSRGMEFAETRPYQTGDSMRTVDWRQTARRGRLYTKLFEQEHERQVRLLIDLGTSMRFGTRVAFKSVVAARAAALLAWTAVGAGERVSGLVWDGDVQHDIRPRNRRYGALPLLHCLAAASASVPAAREATLTVPLRTLANNLQPGSLTVLISDFAPLDVETERRLAALARSTELVLMQVYDIFEAEPPPGCYRLTDGRRHLTLDLRSAAARAAYSSAFAARRSALEQLAQRSGATWVPLATHVEPQRVLSCLPGFSVKRHAA